MAHEIDHTKIISLSNLTANDSDDIDTTINEIVKKHDALAGSIEGWGSFSTTELMLAVSAGVF